MSQWLTDAIERGAAVNDWLTPLRAESLSKLRDQAWPGRKTEAWRYTSLHPFNRLQAKPAVTAGSQNEVADSEVAHVEGLESLDILFVDGILQTDLTALNVPAGVTITSLQSPVEEERAVITQVFGQVKPSRHLFGLINDVLAEQGVMIDFAPDAVVETPIRIVNLVSTDLESHNRVLVRLGDRAKAVIIEHGSGQQSSFNTAFAEYQIGQQANLEHYRFALHGEQAIHIGGSHFRLEQSARLNSTLIGYGSQLSRLDVDIHHAGEHANAVFNTVFLLAPGEHYDLHSTIEHAVAHGTTEENVRGIVGDQAKAVFNGRIHIHRGAQKTLAQLNNRNLLLSRRGQINTKPELEIYADDVQCAHGATVAEIDEDALYYMLTRGLERSRALVMLNVGFIQELIEQVPNAALRDWLQPQLAARFADMLASAETAV